MADYETTLTTNGEVFAFGWDNDTTFRVPTISALTDNANQIQYRAMVHLASKAPEDSLITASSCLQQLSNKVDKTSQIDRENVVNWGMVDYDSGVSIELNTDIVAPYHCFVTTESKANTRQLAAISLSVKVNNEYLPVGVSYSIVSGYSSSAVVGGFFAKGQTFKCSKTSGSSYSAIMYPLKGAK